MGRRKVKRGKKAPKGLNRDSGLKSGDLYKVTTDVEILDVDGDDVKDVVCTHEVLRNGAKMVDSTVVWYGLGDELAEAFVDALEDVGIEDDEVLETNKFGAVVKTWKQLTRALQKINKLGVLAAVGLGEEEETKLDDE